jgi:hypothetical protein
LGKGSTGRKGWTVSARGRSNFKERSLMASDNKQYTNGDAVDIIDNDGLAYAVRHYCDGSYFHDAVTAALWDKAADGLNELVRYLKKETGRDL